MESQPPLVSVVVPVRDRRALLRDLLTALTAQTWTNYEVVVVNDGSTDASADEAYAAAARGLPVTVVESSGVGAVAGRQTGVLAARGEYLAFTDSDCAPDPEWLAAGVAALEAGADVVQGRTVPARAMCPQERSLSAGEEGLYPTCNVFYRRGAFEAAGGFDRAAAERLRFRPGRRLRGVGFGEDTLVAWRVRRAGRAVYAPEAVVRHHVFPRDGLESLRRAWSTGAFPGLVREVPELRATMLVGGLFLEGPGRVGLYAAVVCAAAGWRRGAGVAALTWAVGRARRVLVGDGSPARALCVLPLDLAADAVTAAALLLGSARARTPVL